METSMRGRLATARLSLNTFVLKASAVYAHPCALVEPDRARRVLSVHAETHALEATTGVLLEDMLEESDRKAATPKRRANSEDVDPPDPGLGLQWACQRNPGQVPLFRLGQEPELGVEGGMAQEPLCPILERVARERPRIGEGVHLRLIDAALFALLERAHREAVRPPRRGQLTVEVDHHSKRMANHPVARALEEVTEDSILLAHRSPDRHPGPLLPRAGLRSLEERAEHSRLEASNVRSGTRRRLRPRLVSAPGWPPRCSCGDELVENVRKRREVRDLPVRLRLGLLAQAIDPDRGQAQLPRRRDVVEEACRNMSMPLAVGLRHLEKALPVAVSRLVRVHVFGHDREIDRHAELSL